MTSYTAKQPDKNGFIHYTDAEDQVWRTLYERQIKLIENKACKEFTDGLAKLSLSAEKIPQCKDLSKKLQELTGWSVTPVAALISYAEFFTLLSQREFPAASFIRTPEELDYLMEPDIFHEIFGHTPMLAHPAFAAFTQKVGALGLKAGKADRAMLARLYWFTTEFGLIRTDEGLRIFGAGILSSKSETIYAMESDKPNRRAFNLMTVLRTTYRYDEKQLNYFILNNFEDLFSLINENLFEQFAEARSLGLFPNPHNEALPDHRSC